MIEFNKINSIRQCGFVGFNSIGELTQRMITIPKTKGVYFIMSPDDQTPTFLNIGTGGHFKGRNPNVSIDTLQDNWVDESVVVYIGKAGGSTNSATLHSRLKQYFNFGQGKPVGHWGGRYIWQIKNSGQLIVCWKPLLNGEPRKLESDLIDQFIRQFGFLPFANLKR